MPSLRHLREIMTAVASGRLPLEGFDRRDEKIYESLRDRAVYLHETAENARENLISLIDLYINTTSYQINRVMRVIAGSPVWQSSSPVRGTDGNEPDRHAVEHAPVASGRFCGGRYDEYGMGFLQIGMAEKMTGISVRARRYHGVPIDSCRAGNENRPCR